VKEGAEGEQQRRFLVASLSQVGSTQPDYKPIYNVTLVCLE